MIKLAENVLQNHLNFNKKKKNHLKIANFQLPLPNFTLKI